MDFALLLAAAVINACVFCNRISNKFGIYLEAGRLVVMVRRGEDVIIPNGRTLCKAP